MRFWIEKNKANERHCYQGRHWTYNSAKAFAKLFPYWSTSQINRIISKLENEGVLITGNFNPSPYDRTKWYSLNEEIHLTNSQNGNPEVAKRLIRTDVNTDVNTDTGASAAFKIPEGLNREAWAKWIDYRKKAGKALKPVSWESAMQALVKHGAHQMAVVDQSIANGWQGLFALKPGAATTAHSDGTPLNKQEALEASNRAVVARFLAKEAQREAE